MSCCNGRRSAAARQDILRAAVIAEARPARAPTGAEPVLLLYTGPNQLALRGPGSGTVYRLERKGRQIAVDRRDLATFLRTNLFERVETGAP